MNGTLPLVMPERYADGVGRFINKGDRTYLCFGKQQYLVAVRLTGGKAGGDIYIQGTLPGFWQSGGGWG